MTIENLRQKLPETAKDVRLNLSSILSEEGSEGLTLKQVYIIALASAYATENKELITALLNEDKIDAEMKACAEAAALTMAMNNVYYRFVHLADDKDYASMPAKIRMNMIKEHQGEKKDFELACLAVSAINACGMCINAHLKTLEKFEVSKVALQSAIRIAAVLKAAANAVFVGQN